MDLISTSCLGELSMCSLLLLYQPMEVDESELTATATTTQSQEVNMDAQPSTSGGSSSSSSATTATSALPNRPTLTRLRCESECEDYPEPAQTAPWHAIVPNGWVNGLASDVEEQKKLVSLLFDNNFDNSVFKFLLIPSSPMLNPNRCPTRTWRA